MKLAEDIKPITYVKRHCRDFPKEVDINKRPIVITQNGTARVVLLDIATYEKQENTLLMLKLIARGEHDIKKSNFLEQEEFFKEMGKSDE